MEEPLFILSAVPAEPVQLNHFFETTENSVFQLLRNPPEIRDMGWDLGTLDNPKILKGECWAVANGDRKFIRVYEDGTVIFRGSADNSFLGWGQDPDKFLLNPKLNPIAIIEVVYNFVQFIQKLGAFFIIPPKNIDFQLDFKNAWFENARLLLGPHGVDSFAYRFDFEHHQKAAPAKEFSKERRFSGENLGKKPEFVSFELVKEIYLWFGLTLEEIPYVGKDAAGARFIDTSKIIKRN